jgi:hypothetical protein
MGIFAQGSKIMHRVTPVRAGKEERVSLVFCFSTVNAFEEDAMRTLPVYGDPENISAWEIARHYSWKTSGMLKYIMEESSPDDMSPSDFADLLENASKKLQKVSDIIRKTRDDTISFLESPVA